MSQLFLGISPFYFHGAEGHYGRVHPSLLKEIEISKASNETFHLYFGAQGHPQENDVIGNVDVSFRNPTGLIQFARIKKLASEIELACDGKDSFIQIYEGTIPFLLSLKLAEVRGVNMNAIVNMHQVEVFKALLNDRLLRYVHRLIIKSCTSKPGSILITAESRMSANFLGQELNQNLDVFPIFSTFSSEKKQDKGERPNLVLFSGDFDETLMIRDLEGIGIPGSKTLIIDARISKLASPDFLAYLKHKRYQVVDQRVSENTYQKLFDSVSKVWFLYRLPVNVLGSSGRLMDAISFGHDVVVPTNSALQDFALKTKANVSLIDLESYEVQNVEEENKVPGENGLIEKYDTEFAITELFRMWDKNLTIRETSGNKYLGKLSRIQEFLASNTIFFEWLLLQLALIILRVKGKLRRLVVGFWNRLSTKL
jgi:hypothetical protein